MSELVNRYEIRCDQCDELISRGQLSIMDLTRRGGMVVQVLQPISVSMQAGSGMMHSDTLTSVGERIACSKECATKLLEKLSKRHIGEENAMIALSGQEIRGLGKTLDAHAYIDEAWDGARQPLLDWKPGVRLDGPMKQLMAKGVPMAPMLAEASESRPLELPASIESTEDASKVAREQKSSEEGTKVLTSEKPKNLMSWLKNRR